MTAPNLNFPALAPNAFQGRVALVTGGARGIGAATASELHAGGARVGIGDVDLAAAEAKARELDAGGETAIAVALDVRSKAGFEAARDTLAARWGRVDIVVNNAGWGKQARPFEIPVDEFDDVVAVNMRSVFLSCQVFAEHMAAHGWGRIVNVTSLAGQNGGTVAAPHYAAAKAGATMLTKYFAQLMAGTGVTVNAVSPGPVSSAKGRLTAGQIEMIEGRVPIHRFCEPAEIAAAVALLASEHGGFFVGATLDMNGGLFMR